MRLPNPKAIEQVLIGMGVEPTPDIEQTLQLIQSLPINPKHKLVVWRVYEGYTYAEIAEELNMPEDTIKKIMLRIRQKLTE